MLEQWRIEVENNGGLVSRESCIVSRILDQRDVEIGFQVLPGLAWV